MPVPAPAITSMGPWTCSIASRWRSSGIKGGRTDGVGREFDFDGDIAAQDITGGDEEGCAERERKRDIGIAEAQCSAFTERTRTVAAIAAVSARRMVEPRDAEIQPLS